jgi:hypothetical protein
MAKEKPSGRNILRNIRVSSAEDAQAGDIVENVEKSRAYVITPTADDMVLVRWDNGAVEPVHWNLLWFVKCRG